jgi:hypothetical protein
MAQTHDAGSAADAVKRWFAEHGVPQFAGHYSFADRMNALVLPLAMVIAVQVGVGTWLSVSVVQLLVVPPAMVMVGLLFKRALDGPLGLGPYQGREWSLVAFWLLAPVVMPYLFSVTVSRWFSEEASPWFWPEPWIDTAVVFTALLACMVLYRADVWDPNGTRARLRWWLAGIVASAVALSALEGSLFPPIASSIDSQAILPLPQGLPSLLVAVVILAISLRLALATPGQSPSRHDVAAFVPAVPLLVVTFGLDSALVSYNVDGWAEAVLPSAVLLVLLAVSASARLRPARQPDHQLLVAGTRRLKDKVSSPPLRVWVPVFLLCYPVVVLLVGVEVDVWFGRTAHGWWAAAVTLVANAICLGVAWLVIWFGLDRVAAWAFWEVRHNVSDVAAAFASGLPLLLVFTAFFALTAETWEIAVEVGPVAFVGLLGLLLGLTAIFLLISSIQQLHALGDFKSWSEARRRALGEEGTRCYPPDSATRELVEGALQGRPQDAKPPPVRLRVLGWLGGLNAVLVLIVYHVLIFTPVVVGSFAFFLLLGRLAVPPEVAAEWVYGDGADPSLGVALDNLPLHKEPWTRVAVVLAVFSGLYLSVTVLSEENRRRTFFGAAEDAMRQRLAIRLALDAWKKSARQPDGPPTTAGGQERHPADREVAPARAG